MEFLLRLTVFLTILATAVAWKAAAPEPEPEPLITPGFAAVIILAHTLLTKSMMTMIWRGPGSKADRVRRAPQRPPRSLRAQASRAPCAQANEPCLRPRQAGFPNWMGYKAELEKIPLYNIMCAVQLNEAEYAGPFAAALLFLEAKGAVAPIASGLAVFGQLAYYWPRVFMANSSKSQIGGFNNGFPFYVPAAVARYVALGMLTYKIYGIVA